MKQVIIILIACFGAGILAIGFTAVHDLGMFEQKTSKSIQELKDQTVPGAISDISAKTDAQLTGIRNDTLTAIREILATFSDTQGGVLRRIDVALSTVDRLSASVETALNGDKGLVPSVNAALDVYQAIPWIMARELDEANSMAKPVAANAAFITGNIAVALPDFTDCYADGYGNANCLYNRYVGIAKSVEKGADAGQAIAGNVNILTAEAVAFSKRVGTKVHWYDRLLGFTPVAIKAYEAVK